MNELVSRGFKEGVRSNKTVIRHVRKLERAFRVVKKDGLYKLNPAREFPFTKRHGRFASLKEKRDPWTGPGYYRIVKNGRVSRDGARGDIRDDLPEVIGRAFQTLYAHYVWTLQTITRTDKEETAREILDVFLKADLAPLISAAHQVWTYRHDANIKQLEQLHPRLVKQ